MPVCPGKFWGTGKEATSSRQVGQKSNPAVSEHAQCCPVAGSDCQTQNQLSSVLVNLDVLVEG